MIKRGLKWLLVAIGILGALGAIYSVLFLRFARVPSGAMKNTIAIGDHVASNVLMGKLNRGDVVLFRYPSDPSITYVERIIGLPGERIRIAGDRVFINGKELSERRVYVRREHDPTDVASLAEWSHDGSGPYSVFYQRKPSSEQDSDEEVVYGAKEYTIPAREYFTLGDNRDNSEDSRYFGAVPAKMILAKPFIVYWSSANGKVQWSRILSRIK